VVAVFEISVQDEKGAMELCHFKTVPVFPDRVSNPLVVPEQTILDPVIEPPMEFGAIDTVVVAELAIEQLPL
jgi:hypothetical protein